MGSLTEPGAHKLGKLASEFYYLPVGATFIFSPLNMMFLFVLSVSLSLCVFLSLSKLKYPNKLGKQGEDTQGWRQRSHPPSSRLLGSCCSVRCSSAIEEGHTALCLPCPVRQAHLWKAAVSSMSPFLQPSNFSVDLSWQTCCSLCNCILPERFRTKYRDDELR